MEQLDLFGNVINPGPIAKKKKAFPVKPPEDAVVEEVIDEKQEIIELIQSADEVGHVDSIDHLIEDDIGIAKEQAFEESENSTELLLEEPILEQQFVNEVAEEEIVDQVDDHGFVIEDIEMSDTMDDFEAEQLIADETIIVEQEELIAEDYEGEDVVLETEQVFDMVDAIRDEVEEVVVPIEDEEYQAEPKEEEVFFPSEGVLVDEKEEMEIITVKQPFIAEKEIEEIKISKVAAPKLKTDKLPKMPQKRGRKSLKEIEAEVDLIEIPDDETLFQKQYYAISEVASWFRVNTSLLRFWENEFDVLKPRKNRKGDRLFRPEDVKNLQLIYHLLREKKYTIEGAKDYLKTHRKRADIEMQLTNTLQKFKGFLLDLKANLQ